MYTELNELNSICNATVPIVLKL